MGRLLLCAVLALGCRHHKLGDHTHPDLDADADADGGEAPDTASPVDTGPSVPLGDTGDTGNPGDTGDTGEDPLDEDGDGYTADVDCNDADAAVHPMADEICDAIDNNCDGIVDTDAVDRGTWFLDHDADGFGDLRFSVIECAAPTGYVADDSDCDDLDSSSHPGAVERCDEADNNCDGAVDEGVLVTWYEDVDGDGFGDDGSSAEACAAPPGFVFHSGDCDDTDPATQPGAIERCDGADNDCDGEIDAGAVDAITWYADGDGDGFGSRDLTVSACASPEGYVDSASDCNDSDAEVSPSAVEVCDGVDNDCDGSVDSAAIDADLYYRDLDDDGFGAGTGVAYCSPPTGFVSALSDCDDTDAEVNPAAEEVCDGVDNDCSGDVDLGALDALTWFPDTDGDGFGAGEAVMACEVPSGHVGNSDDCDDGSGVIFPGAEEVWYDGVDGDCAGGDDFDADGDGFGSEDYGGTDCEDADADVVPDADGQCPLGVSCQDILLRDRSEGDGTYTIDPDGVDAGLPAFDIECDMDGGGWMRLTDELLSEQDWVSFTHEGGPGTGAMGWLGSGGFVMEPAGSGCNTAAARATATLPFTFSEWYGSWSGTGQDMASHQDDNRSDLAWGEVTSDCSGHTKFGTDSYTEKHGGNWGGDWNAGGGVRTWTWSPVGVPDTSEIRWEVVDQGPDEDVVIVEIDIWVR